MEEVKPLFRVTLDKYLSVCCHNSLMMLMWEHKSMTKSTKSAFYWNLFNCIQYLPPTQWAPCGI